MSAGCTTPLYGQKLSKTDSLQKAQIEADIQQSYRDSAYALELIKPILKQTQAAYVHTQLENKNLQISDGALRSTIKVQERTIETQRKTIAKKNTRSRWVGRLEGIGIGFAIGVLASTFL